MKFKLFLALVVIFAILALTAPVFFSFVNAFFAIKKLFAIVIFCVFAIGILVFLDFKKRTRKK